MWFSGGGGRVAPANRPILGFPTVSAENGRDHVAYTEYTERTHNVYAMLAAVDAGAK